MAKSSHTKNSTCRTTETERAKIARDIVFGDLSTKTKQQFIESLTPGSFERSYIESLLRRQQDQGRNTP